MNPSTRRRFLRNSALATSAFALAGPTLVSEASSQSTASSVDAHITVFPQEPIATIAPEIYGHFIEHLGGVIYDGVWVGESSKIPNVHGIRKAFLDTMREIKAPVIRWPGGCFADSYDWRDGLGPRDKRPQRTAFWSQEDSNAFGLHEFMETCRAIGAEPYLAADIRSLPARDFYQLVEYCNAPNTPQELGPGQAPGVNSLAAQRARNGSPEPFNVRYWGVGNETWGCGGNQTAEEYAGEYRRYTTWLPQYGPPLRLVACGANGDDFRWAAGVMKALNGQTPFGFSTHYYTSGSREGFAEGDALNFDEPRFYDLLARAAYMERIIADSWSAMGESDHAHKTKIVMDEWGAWYGGGTRLGPHYNLSQQSTMRDALLAAITLDIFQRHADKVGMANVAQTINCLHSLMLAEGDQFTVTPTFDVFKMYMGHMGGTSLTVDFDAAAIANSLAQVTPVGGNSSAGSIDPARTLAGLSGSASLKGKALTLSVVNPHLHDAVTTEVAIPGATIVSVTGTVLAEPDIHAHNDFAHPNAVQSTPARVGSLTGSRLIHTFPAASVTALTLTLA
jgi:alpha-N-arabinofuranosidase